MKIVVAVRCMNEQHNIERFLRGYSFADTIVVSDGGSTDASIEMLTNFSVTNVKLFHFDQYQEKEGYRFNPDNPHINFVLNKAKELDPDWIIYDDMDDVPNYALRNDARKILEECTQPQINAFRLYFWNDDQYFPDMNKNFDPAYKSLWAWKPKEIDIHANEAEWHGTIVGTTANNLGLDLPYCLLHKSWNEQTIDEKVKKYNLFGIQTGRPHSFAGSPVPLPEYAHE